MQTVIPMLGYAHGPAAMDWLAAALGFEEQTRMIGEDGLLAHGEMTTGDATIMLATPTPLYEGPRQHREHCEQARSRSNVPYVIDGLLVYVDDVDAHYALAVDAGATILSGLEDVGPGRRYRAEDLEGHRWMFVQRGT